MGRGLHLQSVFLLVCERAPLFCEQVLTDVCLHRDGCSPPPNDGAHFFGLALYDFSSWTKWLKETAADTNA